MRYADDYAIMLVNEVRDGKDPEKAQREILYAIIDDIDDDTWSHIKSGDDPNELKDDYHVHFRHLTVKAWWKMISEMISEAKMEFDIGFDIDSEIVSKWLPDARLQYVFHEEEGHELDSQWKILKEELGEKILRDSEEEV